MKHWGNSLKTLRNKSNLKESSIITVPDFAACHKACWTAPS